MQKVNVVIGATGIVGSHVLLQLLLSQQKVIACKQKSSDVSKVKRLFQFYENEGDALFETIVWQEIDLRDIFSIEAVVAGADTVYHCAGLVSFNALDRKQLMEINVDGTKNIVNACLEKGVKRLCYVSSLASLHNLDVKEAIDEKVFWKSSGKESDYAISKYKAELEVWRGMEEGIETVIVNPGVILSPVFWKQSSAKMFHTCYQGNRFYPPGKTAYVSAWDVASCMLMLMQKECYGERYILIEGNYTYKEIFSLIQINFHQKPPNIRVNRLFLRFARVLDTMAAFVSDRDALITKAIIRSAFNQQIYSNKKVLKTLDYPFEPTANYIERVCAAYVEQAAKR